MEEKPTLYLESSVISYLVGWLSPLSSVLVHQQITREWWKTAREKYQLFVSPLTMQEIRRGDPKLRKQREEIAEEFESLPINNEVGELSKIYFECLQLPPKAREDCFHIATAVYYQLDYLASWNLKHIANPVLIKRLIEKNIELGKETPLIVTVESLLIIEGG